MFLPDYHPSADVETKPFLYPVHRYSLFLGSCRVGRPRRRRGTPVKLEWARDPFSRVRTGGSGLPYYPGRSLGPRGRAPDELQAGPRNPRPTWGISSGRSTRGRTGTQREAEDSSPGRPSTHGSSPVVSERKQGQTRGRRGRAPGRRRVACLVTTREWVGARGCV